MPFNPTDGCHIGIGVGPNCCDIDACIADATQWLAIDVRPSVINSCPCR